MRFGVCRCVGLVCVCVCACLGVSVRVVCCVVCIVDGAGEGGVRDCWRRATDAVSVEAMVWLLLCRADMDDDMPSMNDTNCVKRPVCEWRTCSIDVCPTWICFSRSTDSTLRAPGGTTAGGAVPATKETRGAPRTLRLGAGGRVETGGGAGTDVVAPESGSCSPTRESSP